MKSIHSEFANTNTDDKCSSIKTKKKFYYGTSQKFLNVTDIVIKELLSNNVIHIPKGDLPRSHYFSDPVFGVHKFFKVVDKNNIRTTFSHDKNVYIDLVTDTIYTDENVPDIVKGSCDRSIDHLTQNSAGIDSNTKLCQVLKTEIHPKLKLNFGSLNDEFPEQVLSLKFLTGNEKVLEIGGNIGRNSMVIAHILSNKIPDNVPNNTINNTIDFVSLECDPESADKLKINRDLNSFKFHIEVSALSKRNLLQKGWNTIISDIPVSGYKKVNTITWEELNQKYNIQFDTLVIDCEGAFYYILVDMPEILNNIKLIIVENDYHQINHKKYVDDILKKNGFRLIYFESGGWGCCYNNFYEAWKRIM